MKDSTDLLKRMKKKVGDIFSITALHYLHAGAEGLAHFHFLLNAIISNVNNASLEELNLVLGIILYKGHNSQGQGTNHELAALLVTEVIQHSLNVTKEPVFMLALDAESAYDRCLRQILSTQLYKANITGTALTFIDSRLTNRATVYQWDNTMKGPSKDDTGFEQGGINSSDYY